MKTPSIWSESYLNKAELLSTQDLKDCKTSSQCQNLSQGFLEGLSKEVFQLLPWYLSHMPPLYLATTSDSGLMNDALEIVVGKVLSGSQITHTYDARYNAIIWMASKTQQSHAIGRLVGQISHYNDVKMARLFTSCDGALALCELYRGDSATPFSDEAKNTKYSETLAFLPKHTDQKSFHEFINILDSRYLEITPPKQIALCFQMIEKSIKNQTTEVDFTQIDAADLPQETLCKGALGRVDIVLRRFNVASSIDQVCGTFIRQGFVVKSALANRVKYSDSHLSFTVLHVVAEAPENMNDNIVDSKPWGKVKKGLHSLSYVDNDDEFTTLIQQNYSVQETNLIRAVANWCHVFLTKQNPYYYSLDRVSRLILRNKPFIDSSIHYFRAKFDPRFLDHRFNTMTEISKQLQAMAEEKTDPTERSILTEWLSFLTHILKTNYFLVHKGGLSFRMDPKVLSTEYYPERPFGFFYMIGKDFRSFQVRYRDIARGGMRVVMPRSQGEYENSLAGLFDEVNGLASAQQLKNKDIPEGGSKCVLVLKPGGDKTDAVQSAVSALLDLINTEETTNALPSNIIDYYGKEEIIYLGPDENLTDDLILWIIDYALQKQYKYAYAFMSSKPDFGINHKTYGVTSEGLNVYVDNVLHYLDLADKPFRVKMTGGPDGDVAGNEMKILYREYKDRCKLVAVADGYGAAYDPAGLDWKEILRLVNENQSIAFFDPNCLGDKNKAFVIQADTPENRKIRDTLYATVEAEIFIPGGGRPYTVNDQNWQNYLLPSQKPSSLAIVEGANIFFTTEARKKLVEAGVITIKDSSANKAGVSCSSYEIIACLTLKPEEFAAIKDIYVEQVLHIIRNNANKEAKLLFKEWKRNKTGTNLVQLSYKISQEINAIKDLLLSKFHQLPEEEILNSKYNAIFWHHCPPILVEKYKDRIVSHLPYAHKVAILSAYMASHLVYKEGLNWLDEMHPDAIFETVLCYINAEQVVELAAKDLQRMDWKHKDMVEAILKTFGAKYLASNQEFSHPCENGDSMNLERIDS